MKPKKIILTEAVTEDELLIGLKTMKECRVVSKNFPEPDTEAFQKTHDAMRMMKCKIATFKAKISAQIPNSIDNDVTNKFVSSPPDSTNPKHSITDLNNVGQSTRSARC